MSSQCLNAKNDKPNARHNILHLIPPQWTKWPSDRVKTRSLAVTVLVNRLRLHHIPRTILIGRRRHHRRQLSNPRARTRRTARVGLHLSPTNRHTPRIDLDETPASLRRQFHPAFNHDLVPRVVVNLFTRLNKLRRPDLHVLGYTHRKVIIRPRFSLAIQMRNPVLLNLELAEHLRLDRVVPLIADADFLVVFDVFVPVALGMQVDLFRAFFVFDAKFVVALAAR